MNESIWSFPLSRSQKDRQRTDRKATRSFPLSENKQSKTDTRTLIQHIDQARDKPTDEQQG